MLAKIGPSLVVTAITKDPGFHRAAPRFAADRAPESRPDLHDENFVGPAARGQHVRVPLQTPLDRARLVNDRGHRISTVTAAFRRLRLPAAHASRLRRGHAGARRRTRARSRREARAARDRQGHRRRGASGARDRLPRGRGVARHGLRRGARESRRRSTWIAAWKSARQAGIDLIIGLGGGSSMDTAKGCNFLLTNGGRDEGLLGRGQGDASRCCR